MFIFYLRSRLKSPFIATFASKIGSHEIGNKRKRCLIDTKASFCFKCDREFCPMESFYPIEVQVEDLCW